MTTTGSTERFGSIPAAAVITACLEAQQDATARSRLARLFGRSPLSPLSRPWYLGALGELRVAEHLAKLGPEWTVLHAVPIGDRGSDIDHVVVGPAGVFTINSKFHEGARIWVGSKRLLVNGQKTDHLRNSRYEAQRVTRLIAAATGIALTAQAAIVLVGVRSVTVRERPTNVAVLRDGQLVRWLSRQPAQLDPAANDRLTAALAHPDSWGVVGPTPDLEGFTALRREIAAARRLRALWGAAAVIGAVTMAAAFVTEALGALLGT